MGPQLTITLDEDVAEKLENARRAGTTIDEAVNEAVNDAVRRVLKELTPPQPFVARARDLGARPGLNFDCIPRLLDEIEGPEWK